MSNDAESAETLLSDTQYNLLKSLALVWLPGLGALYFAVAQIWGLPKAEEVIGTITAVDVFLGLFIGRAGQNYQDATEGPRVGKIEVKTHPETGTTIMEMEYTGRDPMEIANEKRVTFEVKDRRTI